MNFVVQFNLAGELSGSPIPSFNPLEAETLPLAVRAVQKTLDSSEIESAVVYMPVRILRNTRKVEILDGNGNAVPIDAPAGDLDGRIRPLTASSAVVSPRAEEPAVDGK